ncbi:putative polypeptide N-acetylgalactosaminyltransferase 13 isoform X2 [Drosophila ananassae]|uniref:putative polypeptide N-acetylgalactosaminyltransferase 13 isoform X2 n=1 Tax=Drosophila ananassae TaxID=7217 RepID=UPI0013A5E73B|nr:putative polypeptide N-acetylgalactosaminyltransferase 13 isoform X2 [Drosophila ananassae]
MFGRTHYCHLSRWKFYILGFFSCQLVLVPMILKSGIFEPNKHGYNENVDVDLLNAWNAIVSHSPQYPEGFFQYSLHISDSLGAFRGLPTTSHESYTLPESSQAKVSVVISFHNEARSMLLRTIVSLIRRTPEEYLHELIIVDDKSQDATLLDDLKRWLGRVFATQSRLGLIFLTNQERRGLIWSRNRGAILASGHYILFLDSHCEVNDGWLKPLLERLALNPHMAVSPLLDLIDPETLSYRRGNEMLKGGFDWSLHFHWLKRRLGRKERPEAPYKSPSFSGGVLMISREWFLKLKFFNPNLKIWGGESIELAIKLWLCGGQIEIVPCSRIGHIFRRFHAFEFPSERDFTELNSPERSSAQSTYLHNSKIIAESWLDEYKNMFYALKPAAKGIPLNDTTTEELQQFKHERDCHRFQWYLWNVSPELRFNLEKLSATGTLQNEDRCLYARNQKDSKKGRQLILNSCYSKDITQWSLWSTGQLSTQRELCLGVGLGRRLSLEPCARTETLRQAQQWVRTGTHLMHTATHLCLDNPIKDQLELNPCRSQAVSQSFQFALEMERQT